MANHIQQSSNKYPLILFYLEEAGNDLTKALKEIYDTTPNGNGVGKTKRRNTPRKNGRSRVHGADVR